MSAREGTEIILRESAFNHFSKDWREIAEADQSVDEGQRKKNEGEKWARKQWLAL